MKTTILLFFLVLASCSKDNATDDPVAQLPPETQTGANTFGAIINGQIMVPRNSIGYIPPGSSQNAVSFLRSTRWEQLQAGDAKTKKGFIYLYIENSENNGLLKIDNYNIGDSSGAFEHEFCENTLITAIIFDGASNQKTYLSIANTGTINIKRSDSEIISGTFSCKLKFKDNPNDIIEITNGRFDFNKNTINSTNFN